MVEKYRILVIDDDDSIRETLGALLEEEGYIVERAPHENQRKIHRKRDCRRASNAK